MRKRAVAGFLFIGTAGLIASSLSRPEDPWGEVLARAKAYCLRLERAALDFVCLEEVTEKSNLFPRPPGATVLPKTNPGNPLRSGGMYVVPPPPESFRTAKFVYDFQYIRKGADVRERRDLLQKDGEEFIKADTRLETRHFKFREVLFGPILLLSEDAASRHVYRFLKKEKIKGKEAGIVACDAHPADSGRVLTGRAWVRIADGAILRIEWDPESFGGYKEILAVAEKIGLPPKIKSYTDFEVEKNGLLFPSLDATEEIYAKSSTFKYTRSVTSVKYTNYKFFTVDTSVDIRIP